MFAVLWDHGIPEPLVIGALCNKSKSAVMVDENISDSFEVSLAPFLLLSSVDFLLKRLHQTLIQEL